MTTNEALSSQAIAQALAELGIAVTGDQADRLSRFTALLQRWNAVHNLTAIASPAQILTHHLLDSLAILPRLDAIFFDRQISVLDVGAGGGLPGIPLAIVRPQWRVTLLDKVQKKVAFLTQAKLDLGLNNVECVHARAEAIALGPFDLIVSRAFATLPEFVRVSRHMLAPQGWWAAMKGALPAHELADLGQDCQGVGVADIVKLDIPRLDAERHLILLQQRA